MPRQKKLGKNRIVIGLTGSFGSGKSTVAAIFRKSGALVLDADTTAHRYLMCGNPVYKKIVRVFGTRILDSAGSINRRTLADIVFSDQRKLRALNSIVHPAVARDIRRRLNVSHRRLVVLDIPLLFEAGLEDLADVVIVVSSPRRTQIARLKERTGLSRAEIIKRIRSQMSLAKKRSQADFIIDNGGSLPETIKQVQRIRRMLWKS